MRAAAKELREARAALQAATPRPAAFPQPAQYVYYRVTAVHPDSFDLVSDEGEPWEGVEIDAEQLAAIQVGSRFTWDGETMDNHVPARMLPEILQQVKRLNAMPAHQRIQMRTQSSVQTMHEFGYVYDAQSKLSPASAA
jgi:hypothetical protein